HAGRDGPVRGRDRRLRTDRVRGPDGAARRAVLHRTRPALDPALRGDPVAGAAARRRRARPGRGAARGAPGGDRHRGHRRPALHLSGTTAEDGPAVKTNRAVRTPGGLSVRLDVRATVVVALLMLAALTASVVLIGTGDFPIPTADVVRTLFGEGDAGQEFTITELRPPRVLLGLPVTPSLRLGGALAQSVSRNRLGRPDVLGLGHGATTGALGILVLSSRSA